MHIRSAIAGAGATIAVASGVFFAVTASNAQNQPEVDAPEAPALVGHYSTVESQSPIEYIPAPEPVEEPAAAPEPIPAPEPEPAPAPVEEPVVVAPEPQPAPDPAPAPANGPDAPPPANIDLGEPPPQAPDGGPGGSNG